MLPSEHYKVVGVRVASFRSSIAHPTYSPVYASPCTSRYPTQNSGPSGSLLLSRKALTSSTSCRFSPAHCNGDFSTVIHKRPRGLSALRELGFYSSSVHGDVSRAAQLQHRGRVQRLRTRRMVTLSQTQTESKSARDTVKRNIGLLTAPQIESGAGLLQPRVKTIIRPSETSLAAREFEARDPGAPIKAATGFQILGGVEEGAIVHRVNAHGTVVAPPVKIARLRAETGGNGGFGL